MSLDNDAISAFVYGVGGQGRGSGGGGGVLIVKAANTGVHLDESDSTHEAVRALHATKGEKLVSTTHIHTQRRDDG